MSRARRTMLPALLLALGAAAWAAPPGGGPAPSAGSAPPGGGPASPAGEAPATAGTVPPAGTAGGTGALQLEVAADRTAITLGDPIVLTLRLRYPEGTKVAPFVPERSLGSLVVLDHDAEPPHPLEDGRIEEVRRVRITAYELGAREIPALEVSYVDASGREGKATSRVLPVTVTSILAPGDSAPADIKPPAEMPETRRWPWIVLGLLAIGAGILWWWRRRARRPEAVAAVPLAPPRPAHEVAYEELERLLAAGLLEAGRIKEFYIELAEIMKRYLEARYGVDTFERTSAEILEALRAVRIAVRVSAAAGDLFAACDLVKFARFRPAPDETRATVERAYRLVDESRAPSQAPTAPADPSALLAAGAARGGEER